MQIVYPEIELPLYKYTKDNVKYYFTREMCVNRYYWSKHRAAGSLNPAIREAAAYEAALWRYLWELFD